MNQRTFKFRIWDGTRFTYSDDLTFIELEEKPLKYQLFDKLAIFFHMPITNKTTDFCIIQQFTGLKDKNGNEIYEGDLIEINNYKPHNGLFEVIYSEEWAVFQLRTSLSLGRYLLNKDYIVRGNIFENRDLLSKIKHHWVVKHY